LTTDFQGFEHQLECISAIDNYRLLTTTHLPFDPIIYQGTYSNSAPSLVHGVKMHSRGCDCGACRSDLPL